MFRKPIGYDILEISNKLCTFLEILEIISDYLFFYFFYFIFFYFIKSPSGFPLVFQMKLQN